MKKKKFKVSKDLRRNIKVVLTRTEIPHKFVREDDQWYCETVISGEKFHKIVQRAACEKRSQEDGVVYLTYRESKDPALTEALLKQFNSTGFVIISREKEPTN